MSTKAEDNAGDVGRHGKTMGTVIPVHLATSVAAVASSNKRDVVDVLVLDPREIGDALDWGVL